MICVGTTLAAFAMDQVDTWKAWTYHAEAIRQSYPVGVQYFATIQVDARGLEPFKQLLERLAEIGGEYWTYSLDDGRTQVTGGNRLRHLTTGQNLVMDYCCSNMDCSHLLFMAADCAPPQDIITRMLEMNHPLVAPYITTYCLHGTPVNKYPFPVEEGMASAAAIFIAREVFRFIRWRYDRDANMSDDPCFHHDAQKFLGIPTYVRMDVLAKHYPESVGAIETRGHDMRVVR